MAVEWRVSFPCASRMALHSLNQHCWIHRLRRLDLNSKLLGARIYISLELLGDGVGCVQRPLGLAKQCNLAPRVQLAPGFSLDVFRNLARTDRVRGWARVWEVLCRMNRAILTRKEWLVQVAASPYMVRIWALEEVRFLSSFYIGVYSSIK